MMRSLFSGVSGLKNHQTRMDVIGNNISNVNTTGFKSSRVNFSDILSQNLQGASSPNGNMGGTNPKQIGLGSAVGAVDLLFTNGSVQSTGVNTDLALSSPNALFILDTGSGTAYTRNGDFQFDADGNYVQAGNGYFVQGWMANNGTIDTGSQVTDITIPSGKSMPPAASTNASYALNLNAEVPTITKMVGGAPVDDKTYDTPEAGYFYASTGAPLKLKLSTGEMVTVTDGKYMVGDAYPDKTVTVESESVIVSDKNSPVTAHLVGDHGDVTASDPNSGWELGYTTTEDKKSETASANKRITLKSPDGSLDSDTLNNGKALTQGTYTVGNKYISDKKTEPVTVTAQNKPDDYIVILCLEDGTEHDVTTTTDSFKVGTDSYTYGGKTSLVTGYKLGFKIDSMTVWSDSGTGATVVKGGDARRTLNTDGQFVEKKTDNEVKLTIAGTIDPVAKDGTTYTVGDYYESEPKDSGKTGKADANNHVTLYLADGTKHEDAKSGNDYTVGDDYPYTSTETISGSGSATADSTHHVTLTLEGGATVPSVADGTYTIGEYYPDPSDPTGTKIESMEVITDHVSKIDSFTIKSLITEIEETVKINTVDETVNPTIETITTSQNGATADSPLTITLSDGSSIIQTSGTYKTGQSLPIVTTLTVYDTLGSEHELPVYFTLMDAAEDTWRVSLTNDGSTTTSWTEADGSTTTVTMDPITLKFDTNGAFYGGTGTTTLRMTNGSTSPQTVQLDCQQLTQYSSPSTIAGKADGNAAGTLSSISIDKSGTITGTYTNGMKQVEAQVALQRFTNPGGLTKVGESLYEDSNNAGKSGEPSTAATLGATITPAALEMSNVDVANEFTDMIITQRGFQSNSKIITTSDEMLETLINLKR